MDIGAAELAVIQPLVAYVSGEGVVMNTDSSVHCRDGQSWDLSWNKKQGCW